MRTVCEPKWCDGDFYQYFFWFTTTALRHLIKRPILASAFTLFIQFHFHRNSSVFEEFCKLKHPDMEWLICQSMLWWNLQWEWCCNHFHLIFKCRIKPNFSWVQLLKENSEQFASIVIPLKTQTRCCLTSVKRKSPQMSLGKSKGERFYWRGSIRYSP